MSFEENLKRLEDLVGRMESGTLDLDAMIRSFEEGKALTDVCQKELESIRRRIDKVTRAGNLEEVSLESLSAARTGEAK